MIGLPVSGFARLSIRIFKDVHYRTILGGLRKWAATENKVLSKQPIVFWVVTIEAIARTSLWTQRSTRMDMSGAIRIMVRCTSINACSTQAMPVRSLSRRTPSDSRVITIGCTASTCAALMSGSQTMAPTSLTIMSGVDSAPVRGTAWSAI